MKEMLFLNVDDTHVQSSLRCNSYILSWKHWWDMWENLAFGRIVSSQLLVIMVQHTGLSHKWDLVVYKLFRSRQTDQWLRWKSSVALKWWCACSPTWTVRDTQVLDARSRFVFKIPATISTCLWSFATFSGYWTISGMGVSNLTATSCAPVIVKVNVILPTWQAPRGDSTCQEKRVVTVN